jgi:hypothetical protein
LTLPEARHKISLTMPRKAFTVQEANALVPVLEAVLDRIDQRKDEAREHYDKLQVRDVLWGDRVGAPENPDYPEAITHRAAIASILREIDGIVQREILARGVRFPQGGVEHGLVDFPTTWQGRWVYLCWRRGETAILTWHETDAGFAGRQELSEEQEGRMGREDDPNEVDDSKLDF